MKIILLKVAYQHSGAVIVINIREALGELTVEAADNFLLFVTLDY